jgi:hypothetical protein
VPSFEGEALKEVTGDVSVWAHELIYERVCLEIAVGDAAMPVQQGWLEMLERAAQYRDYARRYSDEQVRQALMEFAEGLEQRAQGLNARQLQSSKRSSDSEGTRRLRG